MTVRHRRSDTVYVGSLADVAHLVLAAELFSQDSQAVLPPGE
jgi:hypothetical protein